MTASWPLWHSNSVRNQLLFTVKPQKVVANLAYRKDTSSRPVNYSILNSFGQMSQYISIKFPLHKQSEILKCAVNQDNLLLATFYGMQYQVLVIECTPIKFKHLRVANPCTKLW